MKISLNNQLLSITIALMTMSGTGYAQSTDGPPRDDLSVTIYNTNLGVVREVRRFNVAAGTGVLKVRDVPWSIDPTTVRIKALDHPDGVTVEEQNYEYDLISQTKLLEKYIDKEISVIDDKGQTITGTLIALEGDKLTLSTSSGITMLPNLARYTIHVPTVSEGLITKPTLIWTVNAAHALSNEPLEISYQTSGLGWHTEYIATLNDADNMLDLSGWVSLDNKSGAIFQNAKLKLVAGDVHRATPPQPMIADGQLEYSMKAARPQFQEHPMFEYHVYDLEHRTTLMNNEVKQVSLLDVTGVTAEKRYSYYGARNVDVTIDFVNSEKNHLGMPLPMGTVRVMKHDKDGSLQLVGEDRIEHTPRDEKITLKVGEAFDLLGERKITDDHQMGSNSNQQTVEVKLKNRKDQDVTIDVIENVGANWQILNKNFDYEKKDAYTIVFHVPVKARSESTLSYTVLTHW